jgi:lysozyme family protein
MKQAILSSLIEEQKKYPSDYDYFINKLWKPLMQVEGGGKLHNVAGDSGGWTKYGISYNNNKPYFFDLNDFKNLTEEQAKLIAFNKYYLTAGTQYASQDAKDVYFDISFNMGQTRAIKMAQKCLGINQDGVIGTITKSKMATLTEKQLTDERVKFYYSLVKLKKFLKGWLNRVKIISEID